MVTHKQSFLIHCSLLASTMEDPDDVDSNCSQELAYPELPGPGCVVDTNQDEIVVAILILLLVLVTFYRLIHVWAYTLNFSEVSPCW